MVGKEWCEGEVVLVVVWYYSFIKTGEHGTRYLRVHTHVIYISTSSVGEKKSNMMNKWTK